MHLGDGDRCRGHNVIDQEVRGNPTQVPGSHATGEPGPHLERHELGHAGQHLNRARGIRTPAVVGEAKLDRGRHGDALPELDVWAERLKFQPTRPDLAAVAAAITRCGQGRAGSPLGRHVPGWQAAAPLGQ